MGLFFLEDVSSMQIRELYLLLHHHADHILEELRHLCKVKEGRVPFLESADCFVPLAFLLDWDFFLIEEVGIVFGHILLFKAKIIFIGVLFFVDDAFVARHIFSFLIRIYTFKSLLVMNKLS